MSFSWEGAGLPSPFKQDVRLAAQLCINGIKPRMILVIANAKERLLIAALRRTQRTGQDALRLPFLACQDLVMSMQACPARASSYQAGQSCPSPTFQVKLASSSCSAGTDGL